VLGPAGPSLRVIYAVQVANSSCIAGSTRYSILDHSLTYLKTLCMQTVNNPPRRTAHVVRVPLPARAHRSRSGSSRRAAPPPAAENTWPRLVGRHTSYSVRLNWTRVTRLFLASYAVSAASCRAPEPLLRLAVKAPWCGS